VMPMHRRVGQAPLRRCFGSVKALLRGQSRVIRAAMMAEMSNAPVICRMEWALHSQTLNPSRSGILARLANGC